MASRKRDAAIDPAGGADIPVETTSAMWIAPIVILEQVLFE
jgi:hypothetical protein